MTSATRTSTVSELLTLRPGVSRGRMPSGETHLLTARFSVRLTTRPAAWVDTLLGRLAGPPATATELTAFVRERGDVGGDAENLLTRLATGGWLSVTVTDRGRELYTVVPTGSPPDRPTGAAPPDLTLSRFAIMRWSEDRLLVDSPYAWCEIHLRDPQVAAAMHALGGTGNVPPSVLPVGAAARLVYHLRWAQLAVSRSGPEHTDLQVRQWAPHELWFHRRTQHGHGSDHRVLGRSGWAHGTFEQPPRRRRPFTGPAVALYRPDLARIRDSDPPFTTVLESRRSIRAYDDTFPLHADQLGEFLYRCARNRRHPAEDEVLSRPYPTGGSRHAIELYPVVANVQGLDAGVYHYDAESHRLVLVRGSGPATRRLQSTRLFPSNRAQVLIVAAVRFDRVMWAYQEMAYSLILKDVGVLYQVMYLVATAMGLAPCAVGITDGHAFAEATGLDPTVEGSVGMFALGSRPRKGTP